ncbi:MAG: c-type cytochrome biogenesis protein CcsB [Arsenicicoccus sp.]|uniref:c-type cytochrome biogenesis protein CcsB n=1 Tax=Serinicoccus profundi TaxID=1078471 RepID=UPI000255EC5E|nr:c-type cytochrome biogenesis protein CcsB [Serinicoccus profundi]PZU42886.1 MAG: c-type cytochrome biogenesis protein CcsB [Arsenicicoccus sp.]
MTNASLAQASDIAIWAAIVVLAVAMLAFSVHLAVTGSARTRRAERPTLDERRGVPVSAGASRHADAAHAPDVHAAGPGSATTVPASPTDRPAPSRRWGVIGLQLTWLGTFLVVGGTVLRGLSVSRAPLGNMYEFALFTASFALVVYSAWSLRKDRLWLGAFVVVPVLLILGAAKLWWYTEASQLMPALDNIWLVIHVTIATLSIALFLLGAAVATAYLLRDSAQRKGEVRGWLAALPEAVTLERITYGVHIVAFPLWTFAVMSGAIWAEQAWGRYWGWDPKETWSFVIWVVYAAYLHARATSGWTTRKATWVAIAGFGCIVVNYTVVNLLMTGLHSYSGVAN